MYAYAKVGVYLPHNAAMQYGMGTPVSRSQLAPGDLVFFNGLSHVGMYIGGGRFVHAPHTGDVVKISSLSEYWYAATYVGARQLLTETRCKFCARAASHQVQKSSRTGNGRVSFLAVSFWPRRGTPI